MTDIDRLRAENEKLKKQLDNQKKTVDLLKKRTVQAISGRQTPVKNVVSEEDSQRDVSQRMELASRMKSVFLENVGHEIRTSMNGIVGMTSLVLETELSKEQRSYLEMVNTSVDRLLQVVNEMIDFSGIESGELEFAKEDFRLKEALDHDLYLLKISAEKKGLQLECSIDSNVPTSLCGDADRLLQILTNLVNNGIRYTAEGGVKVIISNIGYDRNNNILIRFQVSDTGCGIDSEKLDLIRHYFQKQTEPQMSLPLSVGTTGLGLTVASQLVKLMKGRIGVDSSTEGSCFWFELPFAEVPDVPAFKDQRSAVLEDIQVNLSFAFRGSRVLLVEDEYISRVLIETILQNLGINVSCVAGGKEAVQEVSEKEYDLVLMDVQMDDIDGLEATRRIREAEKETGKHIPIIAMTALAMTGDRERCLGAGMDDYLSKPVQQESLVEMLTRFLTRRVLIMDTEPESQSTLIATLIEDGWRVNIADSRRSVMYETSLHSFDLIIMDLSFSEQEAMESVRLIRELESYSGQRACIVGIMDKPRDLSEHGFDGIILRPVEGGALLEVLKPLLEA